MVTDAAELARGAGPSHRVGRGQADVVGPSHPSPTTGPTIDPGAGGCFHDWKGQADSLPSGQGRNGSQSQAV